MLVTINNVSISLPDDVTTVADLVMWKHIPENGTAIAVNGKIVRRNDWKSRRINAEDALTVISAAFGG